MSAEAFWRVYDGLPRAGPGSDACTREALRRLSPLPPSPRVLDLGCGPGKQTLVLARALDTVITAVDLHAPFLRQLEAAAAAEGLEHRVHTRSADFGALTDAPGTVDLLWSEGAIYHLGWAGGLARWRPLLRDGGAMALSECTWLTDAPTAELAAFWREAYPTMGTVASNCEAARRSGLSVVDTFVLPPEAWWDGHYGPLEARMEALAPRTSEVPGLAAVLDEARKEIALYRRHGDAYGYVFYLLRAA